MCNCNFCGREDCLRCTSQLGFKIMAILDKLEQELSKADYIDQTGIITHHLRCAWGARDAINEELRNRIRK